MMQFRLSKTKYPQTIRCKMTNFDIKKCWCAPCQKIRWEKEAKKK